MELAMCQIDASISDYCEYRKLSDTVARARKQYQCDTCDGAIATGQQYQRVVSLHDGEIHTERSCVPCRDDRRRFAKAHGYGDWTASGFTPWLDECIDETEGRERRRWLAMRERIAARGAA